MKQKKNTLCFLVICLIIIVIISNLFSDKPTALFLLSGAGGRAESLGSAVVAYSYDFNSLYWNVANVGFLKNVEIGVSNKSIPGDIADNYFGLVIPYKSLVFGMRLLSEEIRIDYYDMLGNLHPDKKVSISNVNPNFLIAHKFGDNFALGLGVGSVRMSISGINFGQQINADAPNLNLGALYKKDRISYGFALANLGGGLKLGSVEEAQPTLFRLGIGYEMLERKNLVLLASTEQVFELQEAGFLSLGVEYWIIKNFALRTGFKKYNVVGDKFSFGFGINFSGFKFDFGSVITSLGVDTRGFVTNNISLSYSFGSKSIQTEENIEEKKIEKVRKEEIKEKIREKIKGKEETKEIFIPRKTGEIINIAVADFAGKNVSQADASIVADFLRTELVNTGAFNVVEKANMDKILAEAAFQQSGCTESECAVQIGKILNVKEMVVGSLSKLVDTYYITVNVVEVETGRIKISFDQEATSARELRAACKILAQKIAR